VYTKGGVASRAELIVAAHTATHAFPHPPTA
jgi:hypothetical protein